MEIKCGGLLFFSNFDSGNLGSVEKVEKSEDEENEGAGFQVPSDYEFNVQTKPDCAGTEHENGNRSWFYFGIRGYQSGKLIRINITNMNRQGKLYSQGMAPMVRQPPHRSKWARVRDRPKCETVDGQFRLSFSHRFTEGRSTYFAFCYPYSYTEQQNALTVLDLKFKNVIEEIKKPDATVTNETESNQISDSQSISIYNLHANNIDESSTEIQKESTEIDPPTTNVQQTPRKSSIYYYREVACLTIDGRNCDVITITDHNGLTGEREPRICGLFPDESRPRPHKFNNKKVFFLSSRVHPGETPASHVFNGFIQFILDDEDERAKLLRSKYVFKLIPMLNPDGVSRGHYRTDNLGCNLNRVYKNPHKRNHPTIFASKALMLFYHLYYSSNADQVHEITGGEDWIKLFKHDPKQDDLPITSSEHEIMTNQMADVIIYMKKQDKVTPPSTREASWYNMEYSLLPSVDSGVSYYIDLHGHASKRGCFIYGNHLDKIDDQVDNQLYAKLVSLNSAHFDYNACNFTTKNMYMRDKRDGMCKDGSGRVAIYKATGIVHSYTLECNYNTGITINSLPGNDEPVQFPFRYTPVTWQGVGKALAVAALDMTGENPNSNVQHSEFNTMDTLRLSVLKQIQNPRSNTSISKKSTSGKWSKISIDKSEPEDANNKPRWSYSSHAESKNRPTVTRKITNRSPPSRKTPSRSPVTKKSANGDAANDSSTGSSNSTRSKKNPQSSSKKSSAIVFTPTTGKQDFVRRNKNLAKVTSQGRNARKGFLLQPTKTNFNMMSVASSKQNNFHARTKFTPLSQGGSQSDGGFYSGHGEIVPATFGRTKTSRSFDRNFLPAVDIGKNERFGLPAVTKWTKKTWNKKLSLSPDFPRKKSPSKGSGWSKNARKSSDWSKKVSGIPDWIKKNNCRLRISP